MIRRLGEKLRRLREKAGMSQTDVAQAIGLSDRSRGYISEIENGRKTPPAEKVLLLAKLFNVSTDYLLRDELDH